MSNPRKDDTQIVTPPVIYKPEALKEILGTSADVAPLIFDINFTGCSPKEKPTLYRQIEKNISPIHGPQGKYEAVYNGTSKDHPPRFSVRLHTAGAADVILADMEDGTFLKTFVEMVKPKFQKDAVKIHLLYSSEQLKRVKMYTRAGRLSGDLCYTFCSKKDQWFWSHDEVMWYSCLNVPVAIDGLRPEDADGDVIGRLRSYKCKRPPNEADCAICQKYTYGKKDDIHESTKAKQDVTLSFELTDPGGWIRCDANKLPEQAADTGEQETTAEPVAEADGRQGGVKAQYTHRVIQEHMEADDKEDDLTAENKEEVVEDATPGGAAVDGPKEEMPPTGDHPEAAATPPQITAPPTGSEDAALNSSEAVILQKLQDAIYRIEIVKGDVDNVREQLNKVTYVQWSERVHVNRYFGIADFGAFTDDLRAMMGFPERECRALAMIHKHMDAGDSKGFEMSYKEDTMKVRYALFALSKRGQKTDIILTTYSMDATRGADPGKVKKAGFLGGLFGRKASEESEHQVVPAFDVEDERVKSYFRLKALEGFTGEGLVDRARLNIK